MKELILSSSEVREGESLRILRSAENRKGHHQKEAGCQSPGAVDRRHIISLPKASTQVPYYHWYLTRLPSRIPARARTAATTQKPNRDGTAQMSPYASRWWKGVGCFPSFGLESRQPSSAFQALKDQSQPNRYSPSSSQVLNTRQKNHNQQPFSPLLLQTGLSDLPGLLHGLKFHSSGSIWRHLKVNFWKQGLPFSVWERDRQRQRQRVCIFTKHTHQLSLQSNPILNMQQS